MQFLIKDFKIYTTMNGEDDHLCWSNIWCVHLKRRLQEETNHHYVKKIHIHFVMKLCLRNCSIGNCLYPGCCEESYETTQNEIRWQCIGLTNMISEQIDFLLSHIVTEDKTWVLYATLNHFITTKDEIHTDFSFLKIMCTVFWNRQGLLLMYNLLQGFTIITVFYCVVQSGISDLTCLCMGLYCNL